MHKEEKQILRSIGNRERLTTQSEYLTNKKNLIEDKSILAIINREKQELDEKIYFLENQIKGLGLFNYQEDTAQIFKQINEELNQIKESEDLIKWIINKSPEENKEQIRKAYINNGNKIDSRIAGKWIGRFISEDNAVYPGEFSFGICQIESKVFGYGALLDSLYTNVFIKGIADQDEISVAVYSDSSNLKSMFNGKIEDLDGKIVINGEYHVEDGFDKGKIESVIEQGIIELSDKGKKLILFSELRNLISSGDSNKLVEVLEKIEEDEYQNEIIIHKKRINNLNKSKRMGILSYSEAQLEETKIVNDILNLITEIEEKYRKK